MRNGLVQLGAWAAATGAAVLLSWLGVHAVLSESLSARPLPLPLPTARPASSLPAVPLPESATGGGATAGGPVPGAATPAAPTPAAPTPGAAPGSPRPTPSAGQVTPRPSSVRSYLVPGGRVALDIGPDAARLVSATPDAGWQLQYWTGDRWMRFDFTKDGAANSVFVTWNGHPPDVQTVVR
ncbi:hypothetical protein ABT095_05220 [Kitasatospora sp. NPDC002227]|uniref:hypothetical protein n=1 Tax=Kitasatospora sp. NPDC002227 TaxID=3154773 RepID=UPI00332CC403